MPETAQGFAAKLERGTPSQTSATILPISFNGFYQFALKLVSTSPLTLSLTEVSSSRERNRFEGEVVS